MADPLFQVGDKVVARRERRLLMTVWDAGERQTTEGVVRLCLCTVDEEHSAAHKRGRSDRWLAEQDLDFAPGYVREEADAA